MNTSKGGIKFTCGIKVTDELIVKREIVLNQDVGPVESQGPERWRSEVAGVQSGDPLLALKMEEVGTHSGKSLDAIKGNNETPTKSPEKECSPADTLLLAQGDL